MGAVKRRAVDRLLASLDDLDTDRIVAARRALPPDQRRILDDVLGIAAEDSVRATPVTLARYLLGDAARRPAAHVDLLADAAVRAFRGLAPRQTWELPSQLFKTTTLKDTILWALDDDPTRRILYVSYDANKAVNEAGEVRDIAEQHSADLRFRLRPDRRARGLWATDQRGGLYAVGIGGGITGFPANAVLLDDLIKGWPEAHSEPVRRRTWDVLMGSVRLRLQSSSDPVIAAGTRWHEDDPIGRIRGGRWPDVFGWEHIRLPAFAEAHDPASDDPLLRTPDPLGRAPGEVICPWRYDEAETKARAAALGPYLAAAVEQQRPAPPEGGEIKREWWRWASTLPPAFDTVIASWDTANKKNRSGSGDYVAGLILGRVGGATWLIDGFHGQWNFAETKHAIALGRVRHPQAGTVYVENTGAGPEAMAELRKGHGPDYEIPAGIVDTLGMTATEAEAVTRLMRRGLSGLVPVNPKGDKVTRVRASVVGPVMAGDVHLIEGHDVAIRLVNEAAVFPGQGDHDDLVDALSQGLLKLSGAGLRVSSPSRSGARRPSGPARVATGRRTRG